MLKILHQKSHDPYFNIATEEYLLQQKVDDFFIIYRNSPAIIVGKHQNANAEINHQFVEWNRIPVIRRLSGGGTVYHDLGNINFSFIMNGAEGQLVDFKKYTAPIIDILRGFGVDACLGGKNDIRVGDKKVSGNAEHVYRYRVLHHGTLLYESDLNKLNEAIQVDPSKYHDNAVKSVHSTVANIADFLSLPMSTDFFEEFLIGYMLNYFPQSVDYVLTDDDIRSIENLVDTKYSTWDWTYGYSPNYELVRKVETSYGELLIRVKSNRGFVEDLSFEGIGIRVDLAEKMRGLFCGKKHTFQNVSVLVEDKEIGDFFQNHLSIKLIPEYFC
ncbi:lipoate--protein ligase [Tenuifilaceae bacterium CYCD]|nr:lipoate--protein ligase [Tenuifilaceae bacterium CYCD]